MSRRSSAVAAFAAIPILSVGLLVSAGAASAAPSGSDHAMAPLDSPRVDVYVSGQDRCAGTWYSGANQFGIADVSRDGHYCYVVYDFDSNLSDGSRINKGTDYNVPYENRYGVNVSGHSVIYWHLCRERSGGPDNCSSERSDTT